MFEVNMLQYITQSIRNELDRYFHKCMQPQLRKKTRDVIVLARLFIIPGPLLSSPGAGKHKYKSNESVIKMSFVPNTLT